MARILDMVLAPQQGQEDFCNHLSHTENLFPCPSPFVSMAPQFSSAFLQKHKELQLVDNIPRGCGLTMNLVAQDSV